MSCSQLAEEQQTVFRSAANSVELDESFILKLGDPSNIAQQYFELYKHRLQKLRPSLKQTIKREWGNSFLLQTIFTTIKHKNKK